MNPTRSTSSTFRDLFDVPRLACLALLKKGAAGVQAMVDVLPEAPGSIYPTSIIEALWYASKGQTLAGPSFEYLPPGPSLMEPISIEVQSAAQYAIKDLVAESVVNENYFHFLFQVLWQDNLMNRLSGNQGADYRREILNLLTEGVIKLSLRLIAEFRQLVENAVSEEEYQSFLKRHPVFLDPLASVVISKQKLGVEFVTDFAIRRYDDKYLLVEIEKPQDKIFTAANDFTAQFSHALGQVLDFQQWVDSNGEYARKLLPGVSSPRGLLVMGRKTDLNTWQRQKLHRFNMNSVTVGVLTYDDLLEQAERLYHNLHHLEREGED